MIEVTHLSGKVFWINPHQIDYIEKTPDTTLCMANGNRIVVKEDVESVIQRIVEYRKRIGAFRNEE
ncbi:MAG: flagellar FlbD family protein [Spirochaetes bacterium]|nr:flagellar FlbD family protein [Spirochaetota bacterium]